jgi:hypothetical protein
MSTKTNPKSFPALFTRKEVRGTHRATWPSCSVCRLVIEPRNRTRHVKACAARKRQAPDLWQEWWCDMHGYADDDPRRPASDPLGRRTA